MTIRHTCHFSTWVLFFISINYIYDFYSLWFNENFSWNGFLSWILLLVWIDECPRPEPLIVLHFSNRESDRFRSSSILSGIFRHFLCKLFFYSIEGNPIFLQIKVQFKKKKSYELWIIEFLEVKKVKDSDSDCNWETITIFFDNIKK